MSGPDPRLTSAHPLHPGSAASKTPRSAGDPGQLLSLSICELTKALERSGIAAWLHGDALLHALRPATSAAPPPAERPRLPTTLLCEAEAAEILRALPHAVATAPDARRLSLGLRGASIDLIPLGARTIDHALAGFGSSAQAFAFHATRLEWCDPFRGRARFEAGELDGAPPERADASFREAPERFWTVGRLLAEHDLSPTPRWLEAARAAFPQVKDLIPHGAVARRQVERVLLGRNPAAGLIFWNKVGLTSALFPGLRASNAALLAAVPADLAVRFAVWLAGARTGRSLRLLRMPHDRARRIERLLSHHPIEAPRSTAITIAGHAQRLHKRLSSDDFETLLAWRRAELAQAPLGAEPGAARERLVDLEARWATLDAQREAQSEVQALAVDGAFVMQTLGCGPGREVGAALAHLTQRVREEPGLNDATRLREILRAWQMARARDTAADGKPA